MASAFRDPWHRAVLASWAVLAPLGRLAPGDAVATSRAWFDELRLEQALAVGLREAGLDEGGAWGAAGRARLLLDLPRPSTVGGRSRPEVARRLVAAWLDRSDVRGALGVNAYEGVEWFSRERWRELLDWALLLDLVDPGVADAGRSEAVVVQLAETGERSEWRIDRLRALVMPARTSGRSTVPASRARSTRRPRR